MDEREFLQDVELRVHRLIVFLQHHDDAEDHRGRAHDRGADEHRLGGRLEGVAGAVALLELVLRSFEVGAEAEVALKLSGDTRLLLDLRKLVDGLGVVGHRAEGVDRDGDGPHAQEAEGDQAEREDRSGEGEFQWHQAGDGRMGRKKVGAEHQAEDAEPGPEGGVVACDEAGENVKRGAALVGRRHDFLHVAALGRGEHLGELRNERPRERAEGDDRGQHPPKSAAKVG